MLFGVLTLLFSNALAAQQLSSAPDFVEVTQQPPPISEDVDLMALCRIKKDYLDNSLLGMLVDIRKSNVNATLLKTWRDRFDSWQTTALKLLSDKDSRVAAIEMDFLRYVRRLPTEREKAMFLERMQSGETPDFVAASIAGAYSGSTEQFLSMVEKEILGRDFTVEENALSVRHLVRYDKASWVLSLFHRHADVQGKLIKSWYRELLNREPLPAEIETTRESLASGENWELVKARLLSSPEYLTLQQKRWMSCFAQTE